MAPSVQLTIGKNFTEFSFVLIPFRRRRNGASDRPEGALHA